MHRRADVDRYLEGALPAAQHAGLRQHLAECEACKQYHDGQVHLLRALAGSPSEPTAAELNRLVSRVMTVTHPGPTPFTARPQSAPWLAWVFPVLGAAAALVLGVTLWSNDAAPGMVVAGSLSVNGVALTSEKLGLGQTAEVGALPAEISLRRGGRMVLQPHAVLQLQQAGRRVQLQRGSARFEVDKGKGEFSVVTPRATVVVLGTVFTVDVQEDGITRVAVVEGRVHVEGPVGGERVLTLGDEGVWGVPVAVAVPVQAVAAQHEEPAAPDVEEAAAPTPETSAVNGDAHKARWSAARIKAALAQGNAALLDGNYDEVAVHAREVLAQDSRNAEAHRLLGYVYKRQGRACEAQPHLQEFVALGKTGEHVDAVRKLLEDPEFKPCLPHSAHRQGP